MSRGRKSCELLSKYARKFMTKKLCSGMDEKFRKSRELRNLGIENPPSWSTFPHLDNVACSPFVLVMSTPRKKLDVHRNNISRRFVRGRVYLIETYLSH